MSEIYVQLTDLCNMHCKHCGFACTAKSKYKDPFMSQAVFDKALELCRTYQWRMTIGGGEPTMHPKIIDWAMEAALACVDATMEMDAPGVLIVTNGMETEKAIKLAKLAHIGVIAAEVSQDPWHDPIDHRVVAEFTRYNKPDREYISGHKPGKGYAGVRDVSRGVVKAGRAKRMGKRDGCICDALFICPNGDFYQCGCQKTKLGNILTDSIPDDSLQYIGQCEREIERE